MNRYSWFVAAAPLVTLVLVAIVEQILLQSLGHWWGSLVAIALAAVAGVALSVVLTSSIRRVRVSLARHGEKLVRAPARELNREEATLPARLQRIVDAARELADAECGVLQLAEPQLEISSTAPQDHSEKRPQGARLLSLLARKYQLHLGSLSRSSLPLSAPILFAGRVVGMLTLHEKRGGLPFGPEDEVLLRWCAMRVSLCTQDDRRQRLVKEQAMAEERERIAREMHDSLAQVLGYINTKAQAVQELVGGGRAELAASHLEQLVTVAHIACGDVREEILALRATPDPDESMLDTLRDYLSRWRELTGVAINLEVSTGDRVLPLTAEAQLQLLRIIQAALSNVRKHAAARQVRIRIHSASGRLETTITDDGVGFDTVSQRVKTIPRFGLAMMQERAEIVGGQLEVSSVPGAGTKIVARLPMDEGARQRRAHDREGRLNASVDWR